jgi:hypothetical protein
VLSGRGLCDELITRSEESYRLWCVVVCDLETSWMRRPWPALGRSATEKNQMYIHKASFIFDLLVFLERGRERDNHTWNFIPLDGTPPPHSILFNLLQFAIRTWRTRELWSGMIMATFIIGWWKCAWLLNFGKDVTFNEMKFVWYKKHNKRHFKLLL